MVAIGTRGDNGTLTFATVSSDNKLYIQNRMGTTMNFSITFTSTQNGFPLITYGQ